MITANSAGEIYHEGKLYAVEHDNEHYMPISEHPEVAKHETLWRRREELAKVLGCGEVRFYAHVDDEDQRYLDLEVEFAGEEEGDWIMRMDLFAQKHGGKVTLMDHPEEGKVQYDVSFSVYMKTDLGIGNTKARVYAGLYEFDLWKHLVIVW